MNSLGFHPVISSIFPTIFVGSMVQFLNAPLMVSTITIQVRTNKLPHDAISY
jgi:hypothetical protein